MLPPGRFACRLVSVEDNIALLFVAVSADGGLCVCVCVVVLVLSDNIALCGLLCEVAVVSGATVIVALVVVVVVFSGDGEARKEKRESLARVVDATLALLWSGVRGVAVTVVEGEEV